MKTRKLTLLGVLLAAILLTACGGNADKRNAEDLLRQARTSFDGGKYDEAITLIDSLRKAYPKEIDERKEALALYQEVELKRSQLNVEAADKALQTVEAEYQSMKQTVEALRAKGTATAEQLRGLTLMRVKRDSLKTVFDVECAKIKYIKKRMEEK